VSLEPDAVERNTVLLKIRSHGVNGVGLLVDRLGIVVVIEQFCNRISFAGPLQRLLDVVGSGACAPGNSRLIVPDCRTHRAIVMEGLVDHVPGVDFSGVMRHHRMNVILKDGGELGWRELAFLHPLRQLVVPHRGVTADRHIVTLREGNQRVPSGEVIGIGVGVGPGMDEAELHLVLCLQLANSEPRIAAYSVSRR
jgi:hypothetical protein